jgi:predicted Zn finger-like uncharacterized protein
VPEDSLEPLVTQCPTCRTRFRVTEAQLNAASGRVRCGACLAVFAGLDHLVLGAGPRLKPGESPNEALDALLDELRHDPEPKRSTQQTEVPQARIPDRRPEEPGRPRANPLGKDRPSPQNEAVASNTSEAPVTPSESKPIGHEAPSVDGVAARKARRLKLAAASAMRSQEQPARDVAPTTTASGDIDNVGDAVSATTTAPAAERAPVPAPAPLELTPEELIAMPTRRYRRWWVPVAVLVAIVLLAAQVLYLQFDTWGKNPDIRPVYESLCPYLKCQLPVMRSLDEIRSKNLVVRANPDVPGELMVDALIVNQARFAQPFPVIELRFSSMEGRPIAARRFKPEEYLAGELKGATMFAPMTPVHIALAVEDPGTDAVSYYIQFR